MTPVFKMGHLNDHLKENASLGLYPQNLLNELPRPYLSGNGKYYPGAIYKKNKQIDLLWSFKGKSRTDR